MLTPTALIDRILSPSSGDLFSGLYGSDPDRLKAQKKRFHNLIQRFQALFPDSDQIALFSTPGRTEVGGNHTDHNAGRVLAAAVDLDILAAACPTGDGRIFIHSEGYPPTVMDTHCLEMVEGEKYSTASLVRGICARLSELGYHVGGFNAAMSSDVPKGSGLSSSAAFEIEVVTILDHLYNDGKMDPVLKAQIAQFAENAYFGKPSGLMDQTTCSVGGFVTIDFKDFQHPIVHKVDYNFSQSGYVLVVVETSGNHADLNEEYAAIQREMKSVAHFFGGDTLRSFSKQMVLDQFASLRSRVGDRAILRALHFYDDDQRVVDEVAALEAGHFERFLQLVNESGLSSWTLLQNVYATRNVNQQGLALAQALAANFLKGRQAAWRVHGGGFAGTVQAFVPQDTLDGFLLQMEAAFGKGSCYPISIRPTGSVQVEI